MAFRATLACSAAKHVNSYRTVLDRFMVSNSALLSHTSWAKSRCTSSSSSKAAWLFEATKSPNTGCWHPPKYSLRRQAKLVREAALTGQLSLLPDGRKTTRITQRLEHLQKSHAFEHTASQFGYIPTIAAAASSGSRATWLGERVVKPRQRVSKQELEAALDAARMQAKNAGPYTGRAKVFKGSRVDKNKPRRQDEIQAKLGRMHQTIQDWHSTQTEAKNKLKPGLPF